MTDSRPQGSYYRKPSFVVGLILALISYSMVSAQDRDLPPSGPDRPGPMRMKPPALPDAQRPSPPSLVLPPVGPPPRDTLSSGVRVFVRRFEFTGNSVFSDKELAQVTRPYVNRIITSEELQELRYQLSLYYVNRGYINSGAVIPDQRVVDGVIHMQIIEGTLSKIAISGSGRLRKSYLRKRLSESPEEILNIETLQQRLQVLQQSDLIKRLNGELLPGVRPGEATLNMAVELENPWAFSIVAANNRSPSVGGERAELFGTYRNPSGWGDTLSVRYGFTSGADDGGVFYALPLNARDTTLRVGFDRSDSSVIEEPFKDLDIDSELESFAIGIIDPVYRTPIETFSLGLTFNRRRSKTFLLGRRFSFSPGVNNGKSDVSVLRFSQEWLKRSLDQVIAARSTISWGMGILGATENSSDPDGKYLAWLGQFQWLRRFGERDYQALFRADVQLAEDGLLPLEQCAVGGIDTVRGYRINQLVRDNCTIVSAELRIPVFRLAIPKLSRGPQDGVVQLAPFADFGAAWNKNQPTPDPEDISSVGIGIRWGPSPRFHAELYWGHAFRNIDTAENDLQDKGISFRIVAKLL